MNTNTQLLNSYSKSTFKLIVLLAGIGIALLTFPTFGSDNQKDTNAASTNEAGTVTQSDLGTSESKKAVNYHNFLASYFLQEASIDRSNLKTANTSAPVFTLAKLPFSVAMNVWTTVMGQ